MIKVEKKKNFISISGHAMYDTLGKDIVCASVSTMVTVTVNAILKIVDGPYPFLQVYKNGVYMSLIWFLLIVGGSFLLSKIMGRIKRK